ncbi:hypothetical protein EVAR_78835_1 [Eumeta japonica]|uniref:Uncharacterized protein n=1 Tax=Eumeta variegata TaxID=151549 RepID=A0A4C1ZD92_EUMVA|nr:hypothetical protein EVAR_78835_1 [Eumeta japonica]
MRRRGFERRRLNKSNSFQSQWALALSTWTWREAQSWRDAELGAGPRPDDVGGRAAAQQLHSRKTALHE